MRWSRCSCLQVNEKNGFYMLGFLEHILIFAGWWCEDIWKERLVRVGSLYTLLWKLSVLFSVMRMCRIDKALFCSSSITKRMLCTLVEALVGCPPPAAIKRRRRLCTDNEKWVPSGVSLLLSSRNVPWICLQWCYLIGFRLVCLSDWSLNKK